MTTDAERERQRAEAEGDLYIPPPTPITEAQARAAKAARMTDDGAFDLVRGPTIDQALPQRFRRRGDA